MRVKKAVIIDYDTEVYDFAGWARRALGVDDLARVHERADFRSFSSHDLADLVRQIEVGRSALTAAFHDCEPAYLAFVNSVLGPPFGGVHAFQNPPSFRLHYSGRGSSAFHRDRDYGVQSGRLNAWIPLTPVWGHNSIWIETWEGSEDFKAAELDYGQALIFDGANLLHGSRWNSTAASRVSFDLRFASGPGRKAAQSTPPSRDG